MYVMDYGAPVRWRLALKHPERVTGLIVQNGNAYEEEAYGRNAGAKCHYYRIAIPMTEIWPDYVGSPRDGLRIEVFETWLERI